MSDQELNNAPAPEPAAPSEPSAPTPEAAQETAVESTAAPATDTPAAAPPAAPASPAPAEQPQQREPREQRGPRPEQKGGERGPRPDRPPRPEQKSGDRGPRPGGDRPDRGPRPGGSPPRDDRRGPRPDFAPVEIDFEKLTADSLYLDNAAHAVVSRMRDMDSGTRSQLRRFYNAVRRACRTAEGERQHEFVMLRARLAYTIARHSLRSLDPLEKLLLQVTRKNDIKGYERFRDLFEAIIAYNE